MKRRTLLVAMAEVELLGLPAGSPDERIVLRHSAVVVKADHGAGVVIRLLCALHLAAVAECQVYEAGTVEDDAAAKMIAGPSLGALLEQDFHILQPMPNQLAARELGAYAVVAAPGERKINELVA